MEGESSTIPRCSRAVSHSRRERQVDRGGMPLVSNLRRICSSKVTRRHLLPVPSPSFLQQRRELCDSCHDANVLPTRKCCT